MTQLSPRAIQPGSTDGQVLTTKSGKVSWEDVSRVYREQLMASGVTPPDPLTDTDGTDYLYGDAS